MRNAAIFGCGAAGKHAYSHLRTRYRIITFLDNRREQHGSRVFGVLVRDPEGYDYSEVDHVFIASMHFDEIVVQLLELGVPCSKIECVSDETLTRDAQRRPVSTLIRRALYLPFRLLR